MFPVVLAVTSGLLGSLLINRWLVGHVNRVTPVHGPSAGGVHAGMAVKFLVDGLVIIVAWVLTEELAVMLGALFGQAILGNIALIRSVLASSQPAAGAALKRRPRQALSAEFGDD